MAIMLAAFQLKKKRKKEKVNIIVCQKGRFEISFYNPGVPKAFLDSLRCSPVLLPFRSASPPKRGLNRDAKDSSSCRSQWAEFGHFGATPSLILVEGVRWSMMTSRFFETSRKNFPRRLLEGNPKPMQGGRVGVLPLPCQFCLDRTILGWHVCQKQRLPVCICIGYCFPCSEQILVVSQLKGGRVYFG